MPGPETYDLTLEQMTAPTPGQPDKAPFQIPLGIGLVGPNGEDMPLDLEGVGTLNEPLIELTVPKRTFRFRNVAQKPVLSLNRSFSAPIRLKSPDVDGRPALPHEDRQRHFQSLGGGADGGL